MIESINNNGGGGGGLESVVAGTGISVDNTDPENPIVTNTVTDTNDKVRVSVNDTTAGYLNGKLVAGTGIGLTENNNGGNETLTVAIGNHDASLITSGTVATARLGTGTANSTTYLRGDQTWAAVDGERIFTTTCLDAENTNSLVNIVSVTVPGGSGAIPNNQLLWIDFMYHVRNTSGISNQLQVGINVGGTSYGSSATSIPTNTNYYGRVRQYLFVDAGSVRWLPHGQNAPETNYGGPNLQINSPTYWNQALWQTYNPGGSSFVFRFTAQWTTANASSFVRILNARAYLQPGQVT
jgi:hypothetical protein